MVTVTLSETHTHTHKLHHVFNRYIASTAADVIASRGHIWRKTACEDPGSVFYDYGVWTLSAHLKCMNICNSKETFSDLQLFFQTAKITAHLAYDICIVCGNRMII